jgi:hypothetical protein
MAQAITRRLLTAPASHGICADRRRVTLGQGFLRVLRYFPVSIIPPWHLGDEQ